MERFIQQTIRPLVSRFVPTTWCPNCGSPISLKNEKDLNEKVKDKLATPQTFENEQDLISAFIKTLEDAD